MSRRVITQGDSQSSMLSFTQSGDLYVRTIYFEYVADAVVGARYVCLKVTDKSGAVKFNLPPPSGIIAEQSIDYSLAVGLNLNYGQQLFSLSLPSDFLINDDDVVVVFDHASISAGDRITNFCMTGDMV